MEAIYRNNEGGGTRKKKRSRGMHIIKVMVYNLHRGRRKSLNSGFWLRLMESIRPFRPSEITTMPQPPPLPPPMVADDGHGDHVEDSSDKEDVFTSVASSSSSSSATSISQSRYGSTQSLNEMDINADDYHNDEDDDDDGYGGGGDDGGDKMIDAKAEEFILRFYAQMRMQNQAYIDRCNAERIQKDHA